MSHEPPFDISQIVHPDDSELPVMRMEVDGPVLSEALRILLDSRLEELDRDPEGGRDWAEIRADLLEKAAQRRASAA